MTMVPSPAGDTLPSAPPPTWPCPPWSLHSTEEPLQEPPLSLSGDPGQSVHCLPSMMSLDEAGLPALRQSSPAARGPCSEFPQSKPDALVGQIPAQLCGLSDPSLLGPWSRALPPGGCQTPARQITEQGHGPDWPAASRLQLPSPARLSWTRAREEATPPSHLHAGRAATAPAPGESQRGRAPAPCSRPDSRPHTCCGDSRENTPFQASVGTWAQKGASMEPWRVLSWRGVPAGGVKPSTLKWDLPGQREPRRLPGPAHRPSGQGEHKRPLALPPAVTTRWAAPGDSCSHDTRAFPGAGAPVQHTALKEQGLRLPARAAPASQSSRGTPGSASTAVQAPLPLQVARDSTGALPSWAG